MKVLFVCECNLNRSPTFENYFKSLKEFKHIEFKSAGTLYGYPNIVNDDILAWADFIFVMDRKQQKYIHKRWPQFLNKLYIVGISDEYDTDDENLISIIKYLIDVNYFACFDVKIEKITE